MPTPEGLPLAGQRLLAVFGFAVVVWITETLDYAVSAVVIGMTKVLRFMVSYGFVLPINSSQGMLAHGIETFVARDFIRTGPVLTVCAYVLTLVFGATYWRWLGDV